MHLLQHWWRQSKAEPKSSIILYLDMDNLKEVIRQINNILEKRINYIPASTRVLHTTIHYYNEVAFNWKKKAKLAKGNNKTLEKKKRLQKAN